MDVKSLKSETDDGLSSCSNFPERPTLEELELLDRNEDLFFRNIRQTLDFVTSLSAK